MERVVITGIECLHTKEFTDYILDFGRGKEAAYPIGLIKDYKYKSPREAGRMLSKAGDFAYCKSILGVIDRWE